MSKKKLLITLGDPAGISAEVIVKSLIALGSKRALFVDKEICIFGERFLLDICAEQMGLLKEWELCCQSLPVQFRNFDLISKSVLPACPSARGGKAAYTYFSAAIAQCIEGKAHALVTAPLCKESLHMAGFHFMGHTDILEKAVQSEVVMTLVHSKIVVAHVTDHLPLRKAIDLVTPERIQSVVRLTDTFLKKSGRGRRIALAGLNPHAGENGILGSEELDVLIPVRDKLKAEGIDIYGPFPADTIFFRALRGEFDAVIAMYHDQGFGPMKTLDMAHGVNATLGIPFVRTSPDHGTAFDLVGKNKADPSSMIEALELALVMLKE